MSLNHMTKHQTKWHLKKASDFLAVTKFSCISEKESYDHI